jgi:tetratricopeptide (TPR) repeat protein
MPNVDLLLQKALQAARAGKELTARDQFLDVVKLDPNNKLAWLWLVGLLDDLEGRIDACRRVLMIDPADQTTRKMLDNLLEERRALERNEHERTLQSLDEIEVLLKKGDKTTGLMLLRQFVRDRNEIERGWTMLAESSPHMDEQTNALARALALNPTNPSADRQLKYLQALQNDPYDLARYYEERGESGNALDTYKRIAHTCKTKQEWDLVYANIIRLERLQVERIQHVPPSLSLARLTAGPAVLYFFSAMLHYGFAPNYAPFLIWAAFLVCLAGSFFIALTTLRLHHPIWGFFGEEGTSGSRLSRGALGVSGVILILVSFVPLLMEAMNRLGHFLMQLLGY